MRITVSTAIKCGSPLEDALAAVREVGSDTVDVLTIGEWAHLSVKKLAEDTPAGIRSLEQAAARHQLKPVSLNTGTSVQLHDRSPAANASRRRETEAFIAIMKRFGIATAAIQPLQRDGKRPWEQFFPDAVASAREQVEMARAAGVGFALELHVASPFESMDECRRLLEVWPDVPVVYDPTHFILQGIPIRETGWLMDRATHCHCRDAAKGKIQAPFGEGEVDFEWVFKSLKDRGFNGTISIEYLETRDFDMIGSAKRLYALLKSHFPD